MLTLSAFREESGKNLGRDCDLAAAVSLVAAVPSYHKKHPVRLSDGRDAQLL
jgi:hypothetical protein